MGSRDEAPGRRRRPVVVWDDRPDAVLPIQTAAITLSRGVDVVPEMRIDDIQNILLHIIINLY